MRSYFLVGARKAKLNVPIAYQFPAFKNYGKGLSKKKKTECDVAVAQILNGTLESALYFTDAYTEAVCVLSSSMPCPCFRVGRGYVPGIPKSPTTTL